MRNLVLLFMPLALLCGSEKPQRTKKAAPPQAPAAVTIPAGAVEVEPHLFRHTAADGKVWLYRKTPFGITKMEEKARDEALRARDAAPVEKVRVTDQGETVLFERSTPLGKQSWQKKRTELTAEERSWLEKDAGAPAGPEK